MNRARAAFAALRPTGRKTLVPYITAGYPDYVTTTEILRRIDPRGCAAVELGIPFSDPIADGPVIQTSFSRALASGFRVTDLFSALAVARADIAVPLLAMVSYSIVFRRGPQRFLTEARAADIDGLIVPDLAFEAAEELAELGRAADCPLTLIVAPTTEPARRRRIAQLSEPFVYYQSLAGVTGERTSLPADLAANIAALRADLAGPPVTSPAAGNGGPAPYRPSADQKPVCVGFGVATPEQVRSVCAVADGAIVGSAIVRRMNAAVDRHASPTELATEIAAFIHELAAPLP